MGQAIGISIKEIRPWAEWPSDEELVTEALAGSREAFDDLVSRHRRAVVRTAGFTVGSNQAEDVAQDAILLAYRALATLRDRTKFQRWLLTITRFKALRVNQRESELRLWTVPLDEKLLNTVSDLACAPRDRQPGDSLLRSAIKKLPPACAEVIRLHFLHGLPHQKISELLGANLSTVKWRCARGKKLIKALVRPGSDALARLGSTCAASRCVGCDERPGCGTARPGSSPRGHLRHERRATQRLLPSPSERGRSSD
jgi:RNA polymerase sigma-70 factor (ECF subfamily)